MKKENIYKDLLDATTSLLKLARESCINNLSNTCLYIISEIKNSGENFNAQRKICITNNSTKTPKPLADILPDLETLYPDFYDVNLYIYKAEKKQTIIEIQYYTRSSLKTEYRQGTLSQQTLLHCKVANPPYYSDTKEKFDINWEFEPFNHKWKMFWWRLKLKKRLASRGIKM